MTLQKITEEIDCQSKSKVAQSPPLQPPFASLNFLGVSPTPPPRKTAQVAGGYDPPPRKPDVLICPPPPGSKTRPPTERWRRGPLGVTGAHCHQEAFHLGGLTQKQKYIKPLFAGFLSEGLLVRKAR